MAELNLIVWNCSGILPSSSPGEKMDFLTTCAPKFDILVLIETHHKKIDDIPPLFHQYSNNFEMINTEATEGDTYAGIVVLVSKKIDITKTSVLIRGRLINFKVKTGKMEYNISALYGYTGKNASKANIKNMVQVLTLNHEKEDENIILGDFNFVDNDLDRTNKRKTGKNQTDNTLVDTWISFINELDLTDPFRWQNPRRKMFSYIHTQDNSKSRIDRVYVNEVSCQNILHYKHIPTPWTKAHRVVSFKIQENNERGPGFWKMNTSILLDRAYSTIVESTVVDVLDLNIQDPIERWLIFIETIRIETVAYCTKKRQVEMTLKKQCEQIIKELENHPMLSRDPDLQKQYQNNLSNFENWQRKQINGYQVRIKTQPKFEHGEPDIAFLADLEKKMSKKKTISHLMNLEGDLTHDTEEMKQIATEYYKKLFDTKHTDEKITNRLLSNVKKTVTIEQRRELDGKIIKEELEKAVTKLQKNKTPGPDGIPAEFYQVFWHIIQDLYFDFILEVQKSAFPKNKNMSITSLIYKDKGEIYLLTNYRPIALMNVDVKILCKLLSTRLMYILPSIIHESQTAVYGRKIGNTINLVRDIIDLANKNNEEAALLFLDQEKAFDRVSHTFLFKVLEKFGFGRTFISWIKLLYFNASTKININGFFTNVIPLKSGVRQGCPLSALLYVLVIEILALQLRANPNIVGFHIEGQKILSSHYADDAVIKITQNKCFKEVIKDLRDYEAASGAKINYDKSKGLWVGKWKNRKDDPFEPLYHHDEKKIKWTNKNVLYLGIYVGNIEPDKQTFAQIVPKLKRRLHFWKPFKLPILAKSRALEIFHASKLFFASCFYPIPPGVDKEVSEAFVDYIKFPKEKNNVSKKEMEKLRTFGGIKLINLKLKSETPKIHWLMRIMTDQTLKIHLSVVQKLIGVQPGHLHAEDLIFAESNYIKKCELHSIFYKEAYQGISKLNTFKHVSDLNKEHLYYNPIFTTTVDDEIHDRTITPFRGNRTLSGILTYGDLLTAETEINQHKLLAAIRRKKNSIHHVRQNVDQHLIIGLNDGKEYKFVGITQQLIYSELLHSQSRDHPYQTKWIFERPELNMVDWDKIWISMYDSFFSEKLNSTIWEQIHLNFYTTYNYNKWHNNLQPCPLCRKIPEDVFHIIMDCKFVKVMWKRIEKTLFCIMPILPNTHEKAFGLQPKNPKQIHHVTLRNWITFSLRNLS